jgi:carboxypeptidase PM20D1
VRRAALGAALGLALLVGVLVLRALGLESRQVEADPAPASRVDAERAARHLAGGLRFRTISSHDRSQMDAAEFLGLHRYLAETYPRVHAELPREIVNDWSLLYTWEGSEPGLEPLLLMAHLDVVPVEPGTEADWEQPAFAGRVAEGQVWGRGAIDDKGNLFAILEAVEALLAEGFQPRRTIHLAFGHDEEVGGDDGAVAIARLLEERGVRPLFVLDEGGAVVTDVVPGIDAALALVTIAEKGSVNFELRVEAEGGHSSVPPRHTSIGVLAAAIQRLEAHPMPGRIDPATRLMAEYLAPELGFPARLVLGNLWLFGTPLRGLAARDPVFDALFRTTTAVTVIDGGTKSNVLPARTRAVVNHRIHPGDSIESVREHVERTVDDERVRIEVGGQGVPRNPSPVSRVDTEGFALIQTTIAEIFPDAVVVPNLSLGGTDARHFYGLTDSVYRLSPFRLGREALVLTHGTNERLAVEVLGGAVAFFERLIRNSAGPEEI